MNHRKARWLATAWNHRLMELVYWATASAPVRLSVNLSKNEQKRSKNEQKRVSLILHI
jgi:hypothetical protein